MDVYITDYGAVGNGRTMNTVAINTAIHACRRAGGGTVRVPPGVYMTGPVWLQSGVTLYLEAGAVILGSPRLEDYRVEQDIWGPGWGRAGLISARDAENVAIIGRGTIDGNGLAFVDTNAIHDAADYDRQATRQGAAFMQTDDLTTAPHAHSERPGNVVRFANCRNVNLREVTLANSPTWTLHLKDSREIKIHAVTIRSEGRRVPNDDGIDLNGCDAVSISDCYIHTGDDCIAIFGGEGITVTNCRLESRSSAIRVGYTGGRDIKSCTFSNLSIQANRGVVINVRGPESVDSLIFNNIVMETALVAGHWWGKGEPIHISALPLEPDVKLGRIRNVQFSNIIARSQSGVVVQGTPASMIEGLSFEHVRLRLEGGPLQEVCGGNFDFRAIADASGALVAHDIPAIYARHVHDLSVRGLRVSWGTRVPNFFSHALHLEDFADVIIDGFSGGAARVEIPIVSLKDGNGISFLHCRPSGVVFIEHEGTSNGTLLGNDFGDCEVPLRPDALFIHTGNLNTR